MRHALVSRERNCPGIDAQLQVEPVPVIPLAPLQRAAHLLIEAHGTKVLCQHAHRQDMTRIDGEPTGYRLEETRTKLSALPIAASIKADNESNHQLIRKRFNGS